MTGRLGVRLVVLGICFLAGAAFIQRTSKSEPVPARQPLDAFPLQVGEWSGQPTERMDARVLDVLRVDDYVNRTYTADGGRSAVGLYVGYYATQRQGQTMHSPLNCLPGAGWEPVGKQRVRIVIQPAPGARQRSVVINRLAIQKGLDKQVVLYWYQSHGRVEASEYRGKFFTVVDAIRLNRTDAAMVRIIAPVAEPTPEAESAATESAVRFARSVFPLLSAYLPS